MTTALKALEHLSEDPETARLARAREESMYFYHSSIAHAERQGEERGRQEGLLEGERKGLLEGERKGLLEGERKGLLEGKRKGLLEGKKEGLLLLLRTKFGEVPEGTQARVQQGTEAELMRWTQRVLSALSLDDVFGE